MSSLLAQSGHAELHCTCPLLTQSGRPWTTFQADGATITIETSFVVLHRRPQVVPGHELNDRVAVSSPHLPLRPPAESVIFGIARRVESRACVKPKRFLAGDDHVRAI